jgi:hypothetical protein
MVEISFKDSVVCGSHRRNAKIAFLHLKRRQDVMMML